VKWILPKIIAETDWGINLVNQIAIAELVSVIKESSLMIGVESFAGHLAAGLNVPFVVLKTGITSQQWAHMGVVELFLQIHCLAPLVIKVMVVLICFASRGFLWEMS